MVDCLDLVATGHYLLRVCIPHALWPARWAYPLLFVYKLLTIT